MELMQPTRPLPAAEGDDAAADEKDEGRAKTEVLSEAVAAAAPTGDAVAAERDDAAAAATGGMWSSPLQLLACASIASAGNWL
jgi:hypothetical protein